MRAAALLLSLALASVPAEAWAPCDYTYPANPGVPNPNPIFECDVVSMPLCHKDVCSSKQTIDVFVKRIRSNKPGKALWMMEGGPGGASWGLESSMKSLYDMMGEQVSIYTMDHRGVGRSNQLTCSMAADVAKGSDGELSANFFALPACIEEIRKKIDDKPEAFSVTSAALDLIAMFERFNTNEQVVLYGCSYGSYLTQRVLHFAPARVEGYILDGVASETKFSFSTAGSMSIEAALVFAKTCEEDQVCMKLYDIDDSRNNGGLHKAWLNLYDRLDTADPNANECAKFLSTGPLKPSEVLRMSFIGQSFFGVVDATKRSFIPAIMKRLHRCTAADVADLRQLYGVKDPNHKLMGYIRGLTKHLIQSQFDPLEGLSPILATLIKGSELWAIPSPKWEDEKAATLKSTFGMLNYEEYAWHCVFSGDLKHPSCSALWQLGNGPMAREDYSKLTVKPFLYKPDKFHRQLAPVPKDAAMLYLQGKLDFQTVWSQAHQDFTERGGPGAKVWVGFDQGPHSPGIFPATRDDTSQCGLRMIAAFVKGGKSNKDLENFDTGCLKEIPAMNFDVEKMISEW